MNLTDYAQDYEAVIEWYDRLLNTEEVHATDIVNIMITMLSQDIDKLSDKDVVLMFLDLADRWQTTGEKP